MKRLAFFFLGEVFSGFDLEYQRKKIIRTLLYKISQVIQVIMK